MLPVSMQRFSVYSAPLDVHPNTPPTHQCIPPFGAHSTNATDQSVSLSYRCSFVKTPQWQPINVYHYARAPFASSAAPSFVLFMLSGFNVPWQSGTSRATHSTQHHVTASLASVHRTAIIRPTVASVHRTASHPPHRILSPQPHSFVPPRHC